MERIPPYNQIPDTLMKSSPSTIAGWFLRDSPKVSFWFAVGLLGLLLAIVGTLMAIGVTATKVSLPDTTVFLEGGWRVMQGQRQSIDFSSSLGPVLWLLVALGMWIGGPSATALVYTNALVFIVVSLLAWMLGRNRLPPFYAFLFAVFAGFMVVGTNVYGAPSFRSIGYAALYNRYGTAFLALVLVESLLRINRSGPRMELWSGFVAGIFCSLIFFLKISYFGVALGGGLSRMVFGWAFTDGLGRIGSRSVVNGSAHTLVYAV